MSKKLGPLPRIVKRADGHYSGEGLADAVRAYAAAEVAKERERIAAWLEPQRNNVPATGAEFAAALRAVRGQYE